MGRLDNKVAIVTGGSRGMGASHVRKFIEEGAKVVFTDILVDEGEALEKELGSNAKFVEHDVTNEEQWKKVVETAEETFGPVNVLVNNAGIAPNNSIENTSLEEYRKVIDINQVGVFLGMKTAIPSMKKVDRGSIVNISSLSGLISGPDQIAYVASKFAVRGMTKSAALELGKYNIRANSVHPGIIETPMTMNEEVEAVLEEIAKSIPLQRTAKPEEVTNLVLFLASDESSYSTGAEFIIDGGLFAQ